MSKIYQFLGQIFRNMTVEHHQYSSIPVKSQGNDLQMGEIIDPRVKIILN